VAKHVKQTRARKEALGPQLDRFGCWDCKATFTSKYSAHTHACATGHQTRTLK
jgi:hypothetical protein